MSAKKRTRDAIPSFQTLPSLCKGLRHIRNEAEDECTSLQCAIDALVEAIDHHAHDKAMPVRKVRRLGEAHWALRNAEDKLNDIANLLDGVFDDLLTAEQYVGNAVNGPAKRASKK
jgi:hypothetical protein